jgi:hypothetical protein
MKSWVENQWVCDGDSTKSILTSKTMTQSAPKPSTFNLQLSIEAIQGGMSLAGVKERAAGATKPLETDGREAEKPAL